MRHNCSISSSALPSCLNHICHCNAPEYASIDASKPLTNVVKGKRRGSRQDNHHLQHDRSNLLPMAAVTEAVLRLAAPMLTSRLARHPPFSNSHVGEGKDFTAFVVGSDVYASQPCLHSLVKFFQEQRLLGERSPPAKVPVVCGYNVT